MIFEKSPDNYIDTVGKRIIFQMNILLQIYSALKWKIR